MSLPLARSRVGHQSSAVPRCSGVRAPLCNPVGLDDAPRSPPRRASRGGPSCSPIGSPPGGRCIPLVAMHCAALPFPLPLSVP
eukprot:3255627-Pyramimonas_sp.AAC.1